MRKAWMVVATVLFAGLGIAMLATGERPEKPAGGSPVNMPMTRETAADVPVTNEVVTERRDEAHEAIPAPDYERELMNSDDRWEFAEKLLVKAQQGDGAAQYYLSMTLSECYGFDETYFRTGDGRRRTYDEVMQHAVKRRGLNWEYVSRIFRSCKRLFEATETPFGSAENWMAIASANGYPRAQAVTAVGRVFKGRYDDKSDRAAEHAEARRLALEALRSKDPGAISLVGNVAESLYEGDAASNPHQWIWLLAACQRGMDCSRESSWYQFRCAHDPGCQPYESGVVDVIRRSSGQEFPDLERRATELNEKIDQGRLDELGI